MFRSPCKNEVLKCLEGDYCDNLIGKKNCERERMSLEGLRVSKRQSRRDLRSTSGLKIRNRRKNGNRIGEKKKRDTFTFILCTAWVRRTPILVRETRRLA